MRRAAGPILSTAIAIAVAMLVLLDFLIDEPRINGIGALLVNYGVILSAFALLLGVANVLVVHARRARLRAPGWISSLILILVVLTLLVLGLPDSAGPRAPAVAFTFDYILVPLQAAMFSLLAFFILNVTYRAVRVANLESFFFILAALVVIVGALPLGSRGTLAVAFRDFFLSVPVTAGVRGILLGIALGIVSTGMRLLFDGRRYFK